MPGVDASAPSPFYRTFLRPDEERPYAKVLLVALDTRQLDLDMEAGNEDPRPLTGPNGPGKLPRDPAILSRVVAAFNGAFKTEHGSYGMMVHKRLLLPPQPGAATATILSDGRIGLGSWGANKTVSGIQGVSDDAIESFRQNLDALVDHGQVNPSGRSLWGYSAPGKGIQTERSGLCVTTSGHLIYAWGDDVSATTLAKAMKTAGCDYGMHLDMNPFHTGFMFARIDDIRSKKYQTELLTTQMEIPKDRYVEWSPKDFVMFPRCRVAEDDVEEVLRRLDVEIFGDLHLRQSNPVFRARTRSAGVERGRGACRSRTPPSSSPWPTSSR